MVIDVALVDRIVAAEKGALDTAGPAGVGADLAVADSIPRRPAGERRAYARPVDAAPPTPPGQLTLAARLCPANNTVADGIYHLGFETCGGQLLNQDGNANATLVDVAFWLSELLVTELANGTLANESLRPNADDIARSRVFCLNDYLRPGTT